MSLKTAIAGGLIGGLIITTGSVVFESNMVRGIIGGDKAEANEGMPLWADSYAADLESGACWTHGDGHGYPTRMWMLATDRLGTYYADTAIQEYVDRSIEGETVDEIMPSDVVSYQLMAYCDGVELP